MNIMLYWLIVTTLNPTSARALARGSREPTPASRAPPRLSSVDSEHLLPRRSTPSTGARAFRFPCNSRRTCSNSSDNVGGFVFVSLCSRLLLLPRYPRAIRPSIATIESNVCFRRESRHRSRDPSIHHEQPNARDRRITSRRVASRHVRHGSKQRDRTKQPGIHRVLLDPLRHACGPILKQAVHHPGAHRGERVRHGAQTRRDFAHGSSSRLPPERASLPRRSERSETKRSDPSPKNSLKQFDGLSGGIV